MAGLNYNHLRYFWTVAKEGGLVKASERLHLTPQTLSSQLRTLEEQCGGELFDRSGRRLRLSPLGETVFAYAEEIFQLGDELRETLKGNNKHLTTTRFTIGISDVIPKLIAYRLLRPALPADSDLRIVCNEGRLEDLLSELSLHRLDLVLADSPISPALNFRLFSHLLGESGLTFFAAPALLKKAHMPFPTVLNQLPLLMPASTTALNRVLHFWFEKQGITPKIVGEFSDGALLKAFGQEGWGAFCTPSVIRQEVEKQYNVVALGDTLDIKERFYAICAERRVTHPGTTSVLHAAAAELFRNQA
jgi:LysR family transcriptional regulator, transcriptional activator of nhaA